MLKNKEIYKSAIESWGAEAQIFMVMEEMAELQKELCKNIRGRNNVEEIAEEIADVQIMTEQMINLYDCEEKVEKYKIEKIERLLERLKQ